MFRALAVIFSLISIAPAFSATPLIQLDPSYRLIISICDQKLMLVENGGRVAIYPVSTSKYGVGDFRGKMTTPLGYLMVAKKIGDDAPVGAVFHHRQWTGEILQPNTPGRDPVTTRIIWLSGLESQNEQAFHRGIYIGTTLSNSRPFTTLDTATSTNDTAVFVYTSGRTCATCNDEITKVVRYHWNGVTSVMVDPIPPAQDWPTA